MSTSIQITTEPNPDMARVAQVLRTMAATCAENDVLGLQMQPALARQIARHLDGGGFQALLKVDAAKADAEAQAEAEDRAAWVARCQATLETARHQNHRAQIMLVLAVCLALFAGQLLISI